MRKVMVTWYECDVCKARFIRPSSARACEAEPMRKDKGAKVGSIVKILTGEGKGQTAVVAKLGIIGGDDDFPARYHHTRMVEAVLISGRGSRSLLFPDYAVVRR